MGETILERSIRERQRAIRRAVGAEVTRMRLEAGLSIREVGAAIGIDPGHLSRVESGERDVSQATLVAIAAACGHDVSLRAYPSSGPRVRDRHQVRMIEALLAVAHPRWVARLEVPVYRPVRGVIDLVLQDSSTGEIVSGEGHSALSAVDAQLRWATLKTDALPSAAGWPWTTTAASPRTSKLLILRSTSAMHDLIRAAPSTFSTAYPASPEAAVAALTGDSPWPGDALLWVVIEGAHTRLLPSRPFALRKS